MNRLGRRPGGFGSRLATLRLAVVLALVAAGMLGHVRDTQAFETPRDIFGCSFDTHYMDCARGKLQEKLNETASQWQTRLDALKTQYETSPFYVKLGMEKDALQAFRVAQVQQLMTCLAGTGLERANALRTTARMSSDPGAFVTTVAGDAWNTVLPVIDGILVEDLGVPSDPRGAAQSLANGVQMNFPQAPPDAGQVADKVWARVQQLGQRDPVTACFVAFIRPMYPAIRQAAVSAANQMNQQLASLYETKVRPLIGKVIAKLIGALINKGFGAEGTEIAKGIVATKLLGPDRMSRSAEKIRLLATAVRARQSTVQPLADAKAALDATFTVDTDLAIELAGELLRYKGHELIWSSNEGSLTSPPGGAAIVQKGIDAASSILAIANGVIDSACGLIPEGGAAVCSMLITRTLRFTWQLGAGILKWGTLKAMNIAMDKGIDFAKAKLKVQGKKLDASAEKLKAEAGPFAQELDAIGIEAAKAYAAPFVGPVKASIDGYNASVKDLADAAASAGR